ncbi:MAG TPA: immunoglobulin domain-containing protein [Opitutaceae bacterium]|nr:immunoglobulin domain-containing protein [Opitutaceae bacterium]
MLITLLQRTPATRVLAAVDEVVAASPLGAVLRSALAATASLGALHSLAGATVLQPSQNSPVTTNVGTPINSIAFNVSNTINIGSWQIGGNIPPGLVIQATQGGGGSLTGGGGMLDATTPGMDDGYGYTTGGNSTTTPVLTGTPTQAGDFTITLKAFEFGGGGGLASNTFNYTISVAGGAAPTFSAQPVSQAASAGASLSLSASASGSPTFKWQHNGTDVSGATSATLTIPSVQPGDAGIYTAIISNSGGTSTSSPAIVGVTTSTLVTGGGAIAATNVPHPNGNFYDQVLVTGSSEAITTQGRTVRTSFIDMNNDIVQVEFAGAGTLSLVLDGSSGPAAPVNYNQGQTYMKGHVGIVITGANETSNISVFTVGRATAFDPTNHYNILLPASATNDPATNGSSLFVGHETTQYDGVADIAFIAISSTNGQFGGVRAADTSFWNTKGYTGVYAPGVHFNGPVNIENINAKAPGVVPVLIINGADGGVRITGGDLSQDNGASVQVSGLGQLLFTAGATSGNVSLPAQTNRGHLVDASGNDVTTQIVASP